MYQSNYFPTMPLISTSHFSHILVLVTNYYKISWVSVCNTAILFHKLIQRMHHFPFATRPRLAGTMPWQSMFWVGKRANRTQLQGIYSCWEHSSVQCPIVSSTIHIKKRCCPTLFSDQFAMSWCTTNQAHLLEGEGAKVCVTFAGPDVETNLATSVEPFQLGCLYWSCYTHYELRVCVSSSI